MCVPLLNESIRLERIFSENPDEDMASVRALAEAQTKLGKALTAATRPQQLDILTRFGG